MSENWAVSMSAVRVSAGKMQLIVGDPETMSADVLRCGAQVVLPADADGHAPGLERIQDLGWPSSGARMVL